MIDDTIRQTRCTACDNEHPYKEARLPRVRRKAAPGALFQEVLAGATENPPAVPTQDAAAEPPATRQADANAGTDTDGGDEQPAEDKAPVDEGPVHRPLIRATLPRPEGGTPATGRPLPEFTVRQATARGRFRDEFRGGFRSAGRNGNTAGHGRPGRPGGSNQQQQRARHGRPAHHNKKRSR